MMRLFTTLLALPAAILFSPQNALGQVQHRALQADATFPEGFGAVSGVRELSDGRLMVGDVLGHMLLWVDMESGTMEQIGREGQGPEEYRTPDALYRLPGDSTLLVDLGNGRLTILDPQGEIVRTTPIGRQIGGQMVVTVPRGVDELGRVYFEPFGMMPGAPGSGPPQMPDSGVVARWDPATDAVDTLMLVKLAETRVETSGRVVRVSTVRMSPLDDWAVGYDGSVVVARAPEYRVDRLADGVLQTGQTIRYRPVPVGRGEKLAYVQALQRGGTAVNMVGGASSTQFGRSDPSSQEPDISGVWP
jgi:hypothetical protein